MSRPLLFPCLLAALASVGCGSEPPASAGPVQSPAPNPPNAFNRAECGTITGLVTWTGPVPQLPPFVHNSIRPDKTGIDTRLVTPPNAPQVKPFTRGASGVVVFLREVDLGRAKPWDHPVVTVELRDAQIVVKQGSRTARAGFVRRGADVTFQSAEAELQVLRGRGAAFFALPFPEPNQPLTRTLDTCGRIDLSSASGLYWQSAQLFVADHPYYAVSDEEGRFEFTHVPAGEYDLVAWHPNWVVTKTERNTETGLPNRLYYAPPLENSRPVKAVAGRMTLANLTLPK